MKFTIALVALLSFTQADSQSTATEDMIDKLSDSLTLKVTEKLDDIIKQKVKDAVAAEMTKLAADQTSE